MVTTDQIFTSRDKQAKVLLIATNDFCLTQVPHYMKSRNFIKKVLYTTPQRLKLITGQALHRYSMRRRTSAYRPS